jgi:hypothetical protein
MARKTQLQGTIAPLLPVRKPSPWHCVQDCFAKAIVSERVHCIIDVLTVGAFSFLPENVRQNLFFRVAAYQKRSIVRAGPAGRRRPDGTNPIRFVATAKDLAPGIGGMGS